MLWDIGLADQLLSEDGVIAYDDFTNPNCLGVNEAFYRYAFGGDGLKFNLVPFAFVTGKLFLCRPGVYPFYAGLSEQFLKTNDKAPWMAKLHSQIERDIQPYVTLTGSRCLRVTL